MKKLLFVLAFAFIGQQAFSQIYIATLTTNNNSSSACSTSALLTKIDPIGNTTYDCLTASAISQNPQGLIELNIGLNSIVSLGYKLIKVTSPTAYNPTNFYTLSSLEGTIWYFAIPWSASGLEEVAVNSTTLKSFVISPNPANTFVDISLDYSLKGESEVVFISEAGYISHKQSIGNISKNEKYNIDISKIPAGKYLVTIVNGKTYTTPQKLIVL